MADCLCTDGLNHKCPRHGLAREKTPKKDPKQRRKPMARGKGPRKESFKQVYRRGFLNGVKAERLSKQAHEEHDERGLFHCEFPGCEYGTDDLEEAKRLLHLHHGETQRSMGQRATPSAWGVDDPGGLVLLCEPHHKEVHAPLDDPRWSAA